jgi:NAD(P)-dependent dehydrogenase (short-subunit alcohol dehydrogenase family)
LRASFDLSGKVAAVTGAGRGLGRAIAIGLAQCGAAVACASRTLAECEETAAAIRAGGGRAFAGALDVARPEDPCRLVAETLDRLGRLDIVMANAGISLPRPALETDEESWRRVIDVNLSGCFWTCQAAGAAMAERDGGAIVVTSSNASKVGFPTLASYCAAKGGVDLLVKTLAIEWAGLGIRVNGIAPGWMANVMRGTEFEREDPRVEDEIALTTPLGRVGTDEEAAGPAIFLASPAAGYVTGVVMAVDGGYCAA